MDECGVVVQRIDPVELEAQLGRALPRFDVDVPQDLEVVGDEPDRAKEHALDATIVKAVELLEDVRPEPRLAGRARALEGERPRVEACPLRDQLRRLQELVAVRVAHFEDPRRKAMRSEDDVRAGPAHAVGEDVHIRLVHVPALDEAQPDAPVERVLEPLAVAVDRELRVVRREDEPDDQVGAALDGAVDRLGDSRRPVLHARVDGEANLALEPPARRLGDLVEGRAANPPVALGELLDRLVGDRPARADVLEVRPDVREVGRAPVRHEDDRRFHAAVRSWTSPTILFRSAGSVSGRTPWPRLKMCPGRPPAASRIAITPGSTRSKGPSRSAGSRFPCTPRSGPSRAQPSSSRTRQSRPITLPPVSAIVSSRCAVPVPKWMRGTSTASRIRFEYGATNSS